MSDGRSTIIPDLFHNTELLGVGLLLAVAKTRLQHRNWLAGAAWAPWPPQTDTGSAVLRLASVGCHLSVWSWADSDSKILILDTKAEIPSLLPGTLSLTALTEMALCHGQWPVPFTVGGPSLSILRAFSHVVLCLARRAASIQLKMLRHRQNSSR